MALIRLAVAWFAGIALAVLWPCPWWWPLAAAAALAAACWLGRGSRARWPLALALVALLGAGRAGWANRPLGAGHVSAWNDRGEAVLRARIAAEPARKDRGVDYRLAVTAIRDGDAWLPAHGRVLAQGPRYPVHRYGETVVVTGTLETPPILADFDYREYLARQGIHSLLRRPRIATVAPGGGNPLRRALLALKDRARAGLAAALPEPEASLATGILLGDDDGIPKRVAEAFQTTNTTHVIAISGSNIALLVGVLVATLGRALGRRRAFPVILVTLALYTALVGADPAVVRAAVMGGIMLLGLHLGRPGDAATALCAAGWAMTAFRPAYLWDLGFQLSFAATAGLILFAGRLADGVRAGLTHLWGEGRAGAAVGLLNEAVLVTLAAQLTTWPLIAYHTGQVSLVGLAANFLILPAQPPVMGLGALAAGAGMLSPALGRLAGAAAWLPLAWTIRVVETMARLPFAAVRWDMGLGALAAYYALVALGTAWLARAGPFVRRAPDPDHDLAVSAGPSRRAHAAFAVLARWRGAIARRLDGARLGVAAFHGGRPPRPVGGIFGRILAGWAPVVALAGLCALAWVAARGRPDGRLHVHLLDIGQGDAILVVAPNGRRMLVDGGPSPSALLAALGRCLAPWDRRLDLVVLSHPDTDHVGGLPAVLARYEVGQVLDPELAADGPDAAAWSAATAAIAASGARRHRAVAGQRIVLDATAGVVADVLWPPAARLTDTDSPTNDNAIVLRLVYGDVTVLLTGDIEAPAEDALLRRGTDVRATVLKLAHHGSKSSTTPPFLAAVSPWATLISVGADNDYGHPAPDVLARLSTIPTWRTDHDGAVDVATDGVRLWIHPTRDAVSPLGE